MNEPLDLGPIEAHLEQMREDFYIVTKHPTTVKNYAALVAEVKRLQETETGEKIIIEGELKTWDYAQADYYPETIGVDDEGKLDEHVLRLIQDYYWVPKSARAGYGDRNFGKVRITIERVEE